MRKFLLVAGARPNFMKIAPLARAFAARGVVALIAHTGQHYDANMSAIFFAELGISEPNFYLAAADSNRIAQTHKIISELTSIINDNRPTAMIVVGDVTSSFAAAMAAVGAGVPVVHVEAGLRSFNWQMPEELNRVAIDHYSELLFVTEESGQKNLHVEGLAAEKIFLVGNVMIDTLRHTVATLAPTPLTDDKSLADYKLTAQKYILVTLHRPQNVDDPQQLRRLVEIINQVSEIYPVIFPAHPRTRARLNENQLSFSAQVGLCDPLPYRVNVALMKYAAAVLTDSGGMQEETTVLGVPCLTLRAETERPITVAQGTNEVVGTESAAVLAAVKKVRAGQWKKGSVPELWDGRAAERIVEILLQRWGA